MSYGLYLSAAGAHVQSQRMEVVSHNLANVDTAGFKPEIAVFDARHSAAIREGLEPPNTGSLADIGGGVSLAETQTSFRPGALKFTGNATDFAINGDGFFLVQDGARQLLTRAGNFHFASDGYLRTAQGFSVLSQEGIPIVIDPNQPWQFEEQGVIRSGGDTWTLGLVQPRSLGDLARAGENVFAPLAPVDPLTSAREVRDGYLEMSAVNPTSTMMELIETSRAYEANVRMMQNHDQVVGSLLSRILRS